MSYAPDFTHGGVMQRSDDLWQGDDGIVYAPPDESMMPVPDFIHGGMRAQSNTQGAITPYVSPQSAGMLVPDYKHGGMKEVSGNVYLDQVIGEVALIDYLENVELSTIDCGGSTGLASLGKLDVMVEHPEGERGVITLCAFVPLGKIQSAASARGEEYTPDEIEKAADIRCVVDIARIIEGSANIMNIGPRSLAKRKISSSAGFSFNDITKALKQAAPVALPIATTFVPGGALINAGVQMAAPQLLHPQTGAQAQQATALAQTTAALQAGGLLPPGQVTPQQVAQAQALQQQLLAAQRASMQAAVTARNTQGVAQAQNASSTHSAVVQTVATQKANTPHATLPPPMAPPNQPAGVNAAAQPPTIPTGPQPYNEASTQNPFVATTGPGSSPSASASPANASSEQLAIPHGGGASPYAGSPMSTSLPSNIAPVTSAGMEFGTPENFKLQPFLPPEPLPPMIRPVTEADGVGVPVFEPLTEDQPTIAPAPPTATN